MAPQRALCLWHLKEYCAYYTSKIICAYGTSKNFIVYNFVDSCSSSTSNKRSSSSKDIGEGGAGSAGKGGKTATGPVGSAGPGRNWGAQAGDKGDNSAVGSGAYTRLR